MIAISIQLSRGMDISPSRLCDVLIVVLLRWHPPPNNTPLAMHLCQNIITTMLYASTCVALCFSLMPAHPTEDPTSLANFASSGGVPETKSVSLDSHFEHWHMGPKQWADKWMSTQHGSYQVMGSSELGVSWHAPVRRGWGQRRNLEVGSTSRYITSITMDIHG